MLADDVVRVSHADGEAIAHRGSLELRLRPFAASLANVLGPLGLRETADQRVAVVPGAVWQRATAGVAAVVSPKFVPSERISARILHGKEAVSLLLSAVRVGTWHGTDIPRRQLAHTTRLARSTLVLEIEIPWREHADLPLFREAARVIETSLNAR